MQRIRLNMLFLALVALCSVALTGCNNTGTVQVSGAAGTEPVEILRQTNGSDQAFDRIGGYLINAADGTKADVSGLSPNYETESVIVVALGEVPTGGYSVRITGVQKKGDNVFVQFVTSQPAPDGVVTQVISHPYAAVAVPKLTGTLYLEEGN